jgi:subtilisin family serine protease
MQESAKRGLVQMSRRWLFLIAGLAFFNAQAFAQIGLVVHIPAAVDVNVVAAHAGGIVVGSLPGANQFLLSVPAVPHGLPDSEIRWMELNQGTRLPSGPHHAYINAPATAAADWYNTQPAFGLIHLQNALTYSTGAGVIVADINSRVDSAHPAVAGHLMSGYDFVVGKPGGVISLNESSASYLDESSASYLDQLTAAYLEESSASYLDESSASYLDAQNPAYGHGTLTAGIIAAVAPGAIIMPLRAFGDDGSSDAFTIARAIRYAVDHGAQIINMSLGIADDTAVLRTAVSYALSRNVVLTASAGNRNTLIAQYPAGYAGVLTTAATTLQDVKASFSNYGQPVYVDAPGVNIISAIPGNQYAIVSGTSFSAPITAGVAALVRAQGLTNAASRISGGAVNIDLLNPGYLGQLGHGRIDVLGSVNP